MDPRFPLAYKIACIILTALFVWAFIVARDPRKWRRWYQAMFSRADRFSINRNKVIDEKIAKYGIIIAVIIFVADAAIFVTGITHSSRMRAKAVSVETWHGQQEPKKFNGTLPNP